LIYNARKSSGISLERFRAKWIPVRVKKARQNNKLEPGSDSVRTDKALVSRSFVTLALLCTTGATGALPSCPDGVRHHEASFDFATAKCASLKRGSFKPPSGAGQFVVGPFGWRGERMRQ
jgi:hypothetical protein